MSEQPTLTRQQAPGRQSLPPVWTLQLLYTGWQVHSDEAWIIPEGEISLGRVAPRPRDIALTADPLLSRAHAKLILRQKSLRIEDNESRNGTFVNGARVESASLGDGDIVRLGDTFLLARLEPADLSDAPLPRLRGRSPAIRRVRQVVSMVAPTPATVILLGETGTGKGATARALHEASGRRGPFVQVNCAAIPENLAESAFFGHKAGSFTGARGESEGYFRAAHGGTLFIDEIGDMPLSLQPKLLHVLDEGVVTPVGSTTPLRCDVRVIAATNIDLVRAVQEQAFRPDLYARLSELIITLPPLRARKEDLLPLLAEKLGPESPPLSPDLVDALLRHHWPFNVRELERMATELKVKGAGQVRLDRALVEDRLRAFSPLAADTSALDPESQPPNDDRAGGSRKAPPDRAELVSLLRANQGVVAEVARQVGRSTKQVYRWMARYDIKPDDFRE